jgi:hypothetical protein
VADRVVLHVGLMKSGTSYLQSRLVSAPESLAAAGVLFPGRMWRDQVNAVSDAIGRRQRAHGEFDGTWDKMVGEIEAHPGTAVISMEFLSSAPADKVRHVVETLRPARVEAIVTVRDLGRTIPSMWQETLKNGRAWPWREYVAGVRGRSGPGETFWREQDAVAIVGTWAEAVGQDATTVLTLPRSSGDPELLWQRFCEASGMPTDAAPAPRSGNESLGAASAAVLGRLNPALGDLAWPDYSRHVKFGLAKTILAGHRSDEEPIGFRVSRWVRRLADEQRRGLEATGVRVVGDLADLEPVTTRGRAPDRVPLEAQLDAAIHAIEELVRRNVEDDQQGGQR